MLRKEWMWEKLSGCRDAAGESAFREDAPASPTQHFPADKSTQKFFSPPILVQTDLKAFGDFELGFIQTPGSEVQGWSECHSSRDGSQLPALNTAFWR